MDFSAHIAAPSMVFEYDYTEISEWEAYSGCLCEHSGNHTSVVYSVNPCGYVAEIESKMGFYGVYVTGTEIYSGVSTYWDEE
jgi:hypothetical protein